MENVRGKNTKRKHLSKNKKKSWKKINTDDIDSFLEGERLQERTGGKACEKTDEALFFIDKDVKEPSKKFQGNQKRKRKAQGSLAEIEETLKPPPPAKKDKRAPDVLAKVAKRSLERPEKPRQQGRARKRSSQNQATYDLWGDVPTKNEDLHYLRVTKKLQVAVPKHASQRPSQLPAVEVPHPGASYNPAYDDHQELLMKAHEAELKKLQQEEKIRRALDDQFPAGEDRPTEESRLKEMSAGLFDDDSSEEGDSDAESDEGTGSGELRLSVNPPVRRENKKDERQRKKERKRKEEEKKKKEEKLKKMKDNSVFRLRSIKREIQARERRTAERQQLKADLKAQAPYSTKRLGKMKFTEADFELKLSEELVGSLRELKPEGSLLEDKFHNLQKRNIIEPRNKVKKHKKYKPKMFDKKGVREIT